MSDPSPATDTAPSDLSSDARPGAWLNKRAAATALGVSEKTVERRVDHGQLQQRTIRGGRVEIWIDGAVSDESPDTAPDAHSAALALLDHQALLLERLSDLARQEQAPLIQMIAEQAEEIGRLHEVERELRAELARVKVSEDVSDRRPWWRRLLG